MTTIAVTFSRQIRKPKAAQKTFAGAGYLKRFRCFIETSDWDERALAHGGWIDRMCYGMLIASVLCFTPVLIKIFLR